MNRLRASVFAAACLLTGCAQTVLYSPATGKRLATFQGDMVGSHYAGGGVTWDAPQVTHSSATLAQGAAAAKVIGATGAAAAGISLAAGSSGLFPQATGAAAPLVAALVNTNPRPAALQAK
jgi:hypothetical protein